MMAGRWSCLGTRWKCCLQRDADHHGAAHRDMAQRRKHAISAIDVEALIVELQRRGVLKIEAGKIAYR